jgi:hypothetical protein
VPGLEKPRNCGGLPGLVLSGLGAYSWEFLLKPLVSPAALNTLGAIILGAYILGLPLSFFAEDARKRGLFPLKETSMSVFVVVGLVVFCALLFLGISASDSASVAKPSLRWISVSATSPAFLVAYVYGYCLYSPHGK